MTLGDGVRYASVVDDTEVLFRFRTERKSKRADNEDEKEERAYHDRDLLDFRNGVVRLSLYILKDMTSKLAPADPI